LNPNITACGRYFLIKTINDDDQIPHSRRTQEAPGRTGGAQDHPEAADRQGHQGCQGAGDLSENAEYAEAKSQQGENESRIAELEMTIKNSEVVSEIGGKSEIHIGSVVKAKFNGSEMEFQIVGSNEADPGSFKISNESPMGRVFMGKKKGDAVEAETPSGKIKYKILEVK
jgi:transcription elongation factor GreA